MTKFFCKDCRLRADIPKLLLVLTDGKSNYGTKNLSGLSDSLKVSYFPAIMQQKNFGKQWILTRFSYSVAWSKILMHFLITCIYWNLGTKIWTISVFSIPKIWRKDESNKCFELCDSFVILQKSAYIADLSLVPWWSQKLKNCSKLSCSLKVGIIVLRNCSDHISMYF